MSKALECSIKFLDNIERWLNSGLRIGDIQDKTCMSYSNVAKAVKAAKERMEHRSKSGDIATSETIPIGASVWYEISRIEEPQTKEAIHTYIKKKFDEQSDDKVRKISPVTFKEIQTKISEFEGKDEPEKEEIDIDGGFTVASGETVTAEKDGKFTKTKKVEITDPTPPVKGKQCMTCKTELEWLCPRCNPKPKMTEYRSQPKSCKADYRSDWERCQNCEDKREDCK